ncbi:nucleoside triphosphate pyrophosphohydrolase family protein [Alkalihalobacillus sp. BA299]|uniref:nucleoside triphosphate pyrophosphohydrolase family protein n=1 Tax=Alkalihalobacillus sp. BA299 TaxID=2815938 RepID=UPI001ADC9D7E|nr:nucleoside triphosphate pyrophosphohydrolase family protein [Alkalihalobacillus sp. BA299]
MNFSQYQKESARTAGLYESFHAALANFTLGFNGEGGEFLDEIKKVEFHGHPLNKEKLIKEAGDHLWYFARLLDLYGIDFNVVAEQNIQKLLDRYPDGFSKERSVNRVD